MPSLIIRSGLAVIAGGLAALAGSAAAQPASFSEHDAVELTQADETAADSRKRGDWSAAVAAAQALVNEARQRDEPLELADALSELGNAQFANTEYAAAEVTFREALSLIERYGIITSASSIHPLRGLGYALASTGRHEEALPHLDRALLIVRRSRGLFDVSQQGILRQLTVSLTRLGKPEDAARHVSYLLHIAERSYGAHDPRMVPWLQFAGDWYAQVAVFAEARDYYRRALDIVEDKLGRNDLAAVGPLRSTAATFVQELQRSLQGARAAGRERIPTDIDSTLHDIKPINPRFLSRDGERALKRAIRILESQQETRRALLVTTLIDLGDWFQIKHQPDEALPYYRRAATLASELSGASRVRAQPEPLSFPVRIYYPVPARATWNLKLPAEEVNESYVEVQFTVTETGSVTDARVSEQTGSAREAADALQAIRAARFRPKFVDGESVETLEVTSREVFRTRKQGATDGDS